MECLAVNAGAVVSRTEIESRIYDEQAEPMSNVVDAAIYALRKKIDAPGEPSLVETRRGMGYILRAGRNDDKGGDRGDAGSGEGDGNAAAGTNADGNATSA